MKNGLWLIPLTIFMAAGCAAYNSSPETGYRMNAGGSYAGAPQEYGADMDMDNDYTYNYLAPHGNWINLDPYGYVWTPRHMGYRWRPYSNGHWVSTDEGWTWMANEEWGSIPFHYGRWGYDDEIGWFWVPGSVWGPAWVSWRWSDQYAGWAPLPPEVEFRPGMNFASLSFNIPNHFWVFLQAPHFLDRDIQRYTLPYERNGTIINYTSLHNNIYYRNNRIINEGFGIDVVRRATRRKVPHYRIQDARQPGRPRISGVSIQIFRPNFRLNVNLKPKAFWNRDEARRELPAARIFEPQQQLSMRAQESAARRRIAEENALLRRTQSLELKEMQRRRAADLAKIRDRNERMRIQQDLKNREIQLKQQHDAERQQLSARHKQDSEHVKRVALQARLEKQAKQRTKKSKGDKN